MVKLIQLNEVGQLNVGLLHKQEIQYSSSDEDEDLFSEKKPKKKDETDSDEETDDDDEEIPSKVRIICDWICLSSRFCYLVL